MPMRYLLALVLLAVAAPAWAQPGRWEALTSMRWARAVAASDDALWVGTDGGVYRYDPDGGEITRYTTVEGLHDVNVRAIAYDGRRGAVWVGYDDGVIDRLDAASGAVTSFFEIARADRFTSRGVNRIDVAGDSLFVATDFGVVVFDAAGEEVRDTYQRFAGLPSGTPAYDVLFAPTPEGEEGVWVGTALGVAWAPRRSPNLQEPAAWTLDEGGPERALALAYYDGRLYAGVEQLGTEAGDARVRGADGSWGRVFIGDQSVPDLLVHDGLLVAVTPFWLAATDGQGARGFYRIDGAIGIGAGAVGPDGRVWVGDRFLGLLAFPDLTTAGEVTVEPVAQVVPDGPLSNLITAIDVGPDGDVWIALRALFRLNGFARFDGTTWTNVSQETGFDVPTATYIDVHAAAGQVWASTEGDGTVRWAPDADPVVFDDLNSTLRPAVTSDPHYVVVPSVATDRAGRVWVANLFSAVPLHLYTPDGTWVEFPRPAGVPSTVGYRSLTFDSFGQLWMTATGGSGGFVVLSPGSDPLDASDDRAVYVAGSGSGGTGLPNETVNAIVEDRSGRMWFGTGRGLAVLFSPGSVFAGGQGLAQPQWARTPDGASFFLRDLRILDIAVDPADQKWLASSDGVWVLNSEGNAVLQHLTPENSPLPSREVVAVEVDPASGAVYFATSGGLFRYGGDAVAASPKAEDLFVFPNPFRPAVHAQGVQIRGLVDAAEVRVLTVDGQVVARFETRGGSVRWDGRDGRTGEPVPSGVYVVAAVGQDGEGTAYGKVAVIR